MIKNLSSAKPIKVLVVDDEPALKELFLQKFHKKIKNKEIEFLFAFNGVEALEKLRQDLEIGIIFTDINMPQMDGLTLLAELSQQTRNYRTVVISAYNDMANIRTAMNRGALDFV